jgi:nitroreductase
MLHTKLAGLGGGYASAVDTRLAIASKRDRRDYDPRPIPEEVAERILDAGRVAGSARNRQPWTFVVVDSPEAVERVTGVVYVPHNVQSAALVVAIAVAGGGPTSLDAGRAAQNMMLAAWNEGVVSCPNGIPDADAAAAALGLTGEERPAIILSFGYPARPANPTRRNADEWSARANRNPLDELVRRI